MSRSTLRYKRKDGFQSEFPLGDQPITLGRGTECDLVLADERASRMHCGIRRWDGDFYLKDLDSKNGTFVNGQRIDGLVKLSPGDRIRVGALVFSFDSDSPKGDQTILREVEEDIDSGKGYSTLLREFVSGSGPST